jgi:hypothetical protein
MLPVMPCVVLPVARLYIEQFGETSGGNGRNKDENKMVDDQLRDYSNSLN